MTHKAGLDTYSRTHKAGYLYDSKNNLYENFLFDMNVCLPFCVDTMAIITW